MGQAFGIVLFVVVIIAAIVAVGTFVGSSKLYDQIGTSGLAMDHDVRPDGGRVAPVASAVRDEEIRQLVEAANARRARRGEPAVDIEAELRRLTPGTRTVDPALRAEIRDMVLAGNARRLRRGEQPLDVDSEIERRIAEIE